MALAFKAGTFSTPTSTGSASFDTGLGVTPSAILLVCADSTDGSFDQGAHCSIGAADGTNQWSVAFGAKYQFGSMPAAPASAKADSQTKVATVIDDAGTVLIQGNVTAFNGDGTVTINWTTVEGTAKKVGFAAWSGCSAECGTKFIASTDASPITVSCSFMPRGVLVFHNAGTDYSFGGGGNAEDQREQPTFGGGAHFGGRNDGSTHFAEVAGGFPIDVNGVGGAVHNTYYANPADWTSSSFKFTRVDNTQAHASRAFGWLIFGGGAVTTLTDGLSALNGTDHWTGHAPRGGLAWASDHFTSAVDGPAAGTTRESYSLGAWDDQDNQWCVTLYGEEDLDPSDDMITARGFFTSKLHVLFQTATTEESHATVAIIPDTSNVNTLTETQSGTLHDLYEGGMIFLEGSETVTTFVPQIYRYVIV